MAIITKLSDDKFNGNHPNGINKDYTHEGQVWIKPHVGNMCIIGNLRTTRVTEILEDSDIKTVFKTLNSTYELIY